MKKLRIQPSFASLSEDELEQLACMVQRETFAIVLERARKPRSEGGFGLTLRSESPLERLLDKKNKLDLINARLCAQCSEHKKLTLADLNSITAGEHRAPIGLSGSDVHDAIMSATYNLVTEHDNTPHQLLALQRLADFPARAELREQAAQIRAGRMEIARSKEQRAAEMHTHKTTMELRKEAHKVQMDLRKLDHKIEMDTFHNGIATERLNIQKSILALREKQHADRLSSPSPLRGVRGSSTSDQFEPTSDSNLDRSPSRRKDNSTEPKIETLLDEDGKPFHRFPSPNPLPHEIYLKNCAYTKKLLAGLVDPLTGRVLDAPSSVDPVSRADAKNETSPSLNETNAQVGPVLCATRTSSEQFTLPSGPSSRDEINPTNAQVGPVSPSGPLSRDEINPANAAPADPNATNIQNSSAPADPKSEISNQKSEIDVTPFNSASSVPSPSVPSVLLSPAELAAAVDRYTVNRAREHGIYERDITPWPYRHSPPPYLTEFRHCPCGQACPCPTHESEEFGPYPETFWKVSPFHPVYRDCLRYRDLPYREPTEYLP